VTTLRIAHAHKHVGRVGHLVVLADDAGHQAVPIWVWGDQGIPQLSDFMELASRPAGQDITAGVPQELTTRLLGAARAQVTGVDIDLTKADAEELNQEVAVARIGLAGPAGTRQVTAALGLALALAAVAGAPVRLADAVLHRLAVPVPGDDLLTPFLDRVPAAVPTLPGYGLRPLAPLRGSRPRYEPRNLDFTDGLNRWDLDTWPDPDRPEPDYAAAAEGPSAVLSSVVPRPAWPAALVQAVYADDYRGATATFSAEIRADLLTGQAGLRLETLQGWSPSREDHVRIIGRVRVWTRYQITARIPADADLIRFGIGLTGSGWIALRNPDLRIAEPAPGTP
jgi:hypothetical protein